MKKVLLTVNDYSHKGKLYPKDSVIEVPDEEGTIIINTGRGIIADDKATVTDPPPARPVPGSPEEARQKAEEVQRRPGPVTTPDAVEQATERDKAAAENDAKLKATGKHR